MVKHMMRVGLTLKKKMMAMRKVNILAMMTWAVKSTRIGPLWKNFLLTHQMMMRTSQTLLSKGVPFFNCRNTETVE